MSNPITTPDPSVHYTPPPGSGQPTPTPALGAALFDGLVGKIAMAIGNVDVLGTHPLQFLANFGASLVNTSNGILANLYGDGTTEVPGNPSIQHAALPNTYANLGPDIDKLIGDMLNPFAWLNVPSDVIVLVEDLVGVPHESQIAVPGQFPAEKVSSVNGGGTSLGADVAAGQSKQDQTLGNLYCAGTTSVPVDPSLQYAAMPRGWLNLPGDLLKFGLDVIDVFAWGNVAGDLVNIVADLTGQTPDAVSGVKPGVPPIPASAVSSVTGAASMADDVTNTSTAASNASAAATSASATAAAAASAIAKVGINLLAAPAGVSLAAEIVAGIRGVGDPGSSVWYQVAAADVSGLPGSPSGEVHFSITAPQTQVTVSWDAVAGAAGYNVYRGTAAGAESEYVELGNVTTFVDDGSS